MNLKKFFEVFLYKNENTIIKFNIDFIIKKSFTKMLYILYFPFENDFDYLTMLLVNRGCYFV